MESRHRGVGQSARARFARHHDHDGRSPAAGGYQHLGSQGWRGRDQYLPQHRHRSRRDHSRRRLGAVRFGSGRRRHQPDSAQELRGARTATGLEPSPRRRSAKPLHEPVGRRPGRTRQHGLRHGTARHGSNALHRPPGLHHQRQGPVAEPHLHALVARRWQPQFAGRLHGAGSRQQRPTAGLEQRLGPCVAGTGLGRPAGRQCHRRSLGSRTACRPGLRLWFRRRQRRLGHADNGAHSRRPRHQRTREHLQRPGQARQLPERHAACPQRHLARRRLHHVGFRHAGPAGRNRTAQSHGVLRLRVQRLHQVSRRSRCGHAGLLHPRRHRRTRRVGQHLLVWPQRAHRHRREPGQSVPGLCRWLQRPRLCGPEYAEPIGLDRHQRQRPLRLWR